MWYWNWFISICVHQEGWSSYSQDKARIDFEWGENISEIFPLIQEQARSIVEANQEIVSAFEMKTQS